MSGKSSHPSENPNVKRFWPPMGFLGSQLSLVRDWALDVGSELQWGGQGSMADTNFFLQFHLDVDMRWGR